MKKHLCKLIALCLPALSAYSQAIAQTPAAPAKTENKTTIDTVIVRLNNKLYYAVTENKQWRINNGKVTFSTYNANDTLPDIDLDYVSSKPSLVKRFRKGDTIQNCLFGEIKLSFSDFMDETQKKNGVHNVCSRKLVFLNCVFNRILADTTEELYEDDSKQKKKLLFKQDLMFINCNFAKGLEMSDCIFQKKFFLTGQITCNLPSSIDNCEFDDLCYIFSAPDYNKGNSYLKIHSCTFNEPCIFSVVDNEQSHITIERCKFNSVFSLGKSISQNIFKRFHANYNSSGYVQHIYNYGTYYANFLKNKYNKEYYINDDTIQAFMPNNHLIYNVTLAHCKAKIVDVANAGMMDCSLEDVSILKCIDVTGSTFTYSTTFTGKQALEDVNFPNNNCIIYASYKTFSPEAFKLNIYLEKIQIHPLVHNYFDSTSDFMQDNSNFFNMVKDYSAKKFTNEDMVTTLKARYQHEQAAWERSYYAAHIMHSKGVGDFIGSLFQWSLAWFLEITVSTGYRGEWKFAIWVVFLIMLFSSIYFLRHREAVIDYLNSKFNKMDDGEIEKFQTLKVYGPFSGFRDFARCFWFSCMVFVDPRLPVSFFNLRVGLFGLVLTEWLCGITAIILFLVFLASNYPFIHSLIGI